MTKEETLFHQIAASTPDAAEGKMFGALCIKAPNGKSGVMFWKNDAVFKLPEEMSKMALSLKGAALFDPMGGKPMKEWVQIPAAHSDKWKLFTAEAIGYVKNITAAKIPKPKKAKKK